MSLSEWKLFDRGSDAGQGIAEGCSAIDRVGRLFVLQLCYALENDKPRSIAGSFVQTETFVVPNLENGTQTVPSIDDFVVICDDFGGIF